VGNEKTIIFDPFCLDLLNECLWKGSQAIKLRPKAFAVLHYLLQRPLQLVTKEELLNAVWPETFVGEAVLKVTIRQIREALDDDPVTPRYIETAHRRGYRFIHPIAERSRTLFYGERRNGVFTAAPDVPDSSRNVVGRDVALARMLAWLDRVLRGERQIVFVSGEAGIGKTAVVDTFVRSIAADRNIRIGRGQCLEHYGTSEAYLPVLEAIGRLAREQQQVVSALRAHAPMWLLQLPSLVSVYDRESLSREAVGATRERMLREIGSALEALTADTPLVLIFEDLHWSDYSTLDLISYLASQRQGSRLMLIGTYRTAELIASGHPLQAVKRDLLGKQQCVELPLEYLNREAVAAYLSVRFPTHRFPESLAGLIHERTEGNPLFMVNAVDYLLAEGLIGEREGRWTLVVPIENVEVGVPDSVRQMIEKQLDHLAADEQRTLEAASVAGAEFSTVAVMAGLSGEGTAVEAKCDALARQHQFIQGFGLEVLPNGEAVNRYGFIHALYQNVLYERVSAFKRVQLHRRIGQQLETLYSDRVSEIAAELAMHFERGAEFRQAVRYLQQTVENAIHRFAYREAVALSRHGLELIERLPDTPERAQQELQLLITLGMPLIATEGYAAPSVGRVYTRARELCMPHGDAAEIAQVLWGLWTFFVVRAEMGTSLEIAQEYLRVAEQFPYSNVAVGITLMHSGDFTPAMQFFQKTLSLYDPERHRIDAFRYSQNPAVAAQCHGGWTPWFLGEPDRAVDTLRKALTLARELNEPHGLAHVFLFLSVLHQLRRESSIAREYANASVAVSIEHKLVLYEAASSVVRGWTMIEQGQAEKAAEEIRQALAAYEATGTQLLRPHFLALLAEALGKAKKTEEGLKVLEEAMATANTNGEHYYDAEIYRLKGELLLQQSVQHVLHRAAGVGKTVAETDLSVHAAAERCFSESIAIAQRQKAKSFQLRAAMSASRLYRDQGRREQARSVVLEIYNSFTEGFDTPDLREARAMLDDLS